MTGAGRLPLVDSDTDDPQLANVFGRFRDAGHEVPTLYRTLGNAPAMLNGTNAAVYSSVCCTAPRNVGSSASRL